MEKFQRLQTALRAEPVEPVPVALWRHFHLQDRDPGTLAQVTADYSRRYDLDLVKLTPSGLYAVEDWGAEIHYPGTETDPPYLERPVVAEPADWRSLRQRGTAALDRELEMIRRTRALLGPEWPVVMTIFSPLTLAFKLAGERLLDHLRTDPDAVHVGLRTLTPVATAFAHAALDAGADGFFFATQLSRSGLCTREQITSFGLAYDLEVLESVAFRSRVTILHLHGTGVYFDLVHDYPVDAVSWHDRETSPALAEARELTDLAFVAGLDRELLRDGPPEAIDAQARDAIAQTDGLGLILAPSCVIPPETPPAHLQAVLGAQA